jgi:hypothetical protein
MPLTPLVHLTLPDLATHSVEAHFAPIVLLLEGPIKVNEHHIRLQNNKFLRGEAPIPFPPLYTSGAYYEEDPAGREDWRDVYSCLEKLAGGHGIDCDNLICWRVAELRVAGVNAEPVIKWQHIPHELAVSIGYPADFVSGEGLWLVHCCVRFPDGTIEDTSKNLGMGAEYNNKR